MCGPVLVGGTLAALGAGTQLYAADQRAETQQQVADYNARMQEIEAAQIKERGIAKENLLREQAADKVAQQRAQAAAAGVNPGQGGAFQLQEGVRLQSNAEALQIRENFEQRSQAAKTGAELTRFQGEAQSYNTLLSGVGRAFSTGASLFNTGASAYNALNPGGGGGSGSGSSGGS